jgi:cystathionine gamma-synthase
MNTERTASRGTLVSQSLLVAAGRDRRPGAAQRTAVLASNFVLGTSAGMPGRAHDVRSAEEIVGLLEGGQSIAFASGMAGVATVFANFGSDHASCFRTLLSGRGRARRVRKARASGASPDWPWTMDGWIRAAADSDLLWLESPSNPLLVVADACNLFNLSEVSTIGGRQYVRNIA